MFYKTNWYLYIDDAFYLFSLQKSLWICHDQQFQVQNFLFFQSYLLFCLSFNICIQSTANVCFYINCILCYINDQYASIT